MYGKLLQLRNERLGEQYIINELIDVSKEGYETHRALEAPVSLQDILRMFIEKKDKIVELLFMQTENHLMVRMLDNKCFTIDISKSISEQSEETLAEIIKLLE